MRKNHFKDVSDFAFRNRLKRWVFLLLPSRFSVWMFRTVLDRDIERNSLSSAKFLVDAQKIYPTRNYFLLSKFLRFSLRLAGTNLPRQYLQLITDSVMKTRRNPSKRNAVAENIYQRTLNLDYRQSSAHGWKFISLALSGFGFIRAGTVTRNYSLKAALYEVDAGTSTRRTLDLAIRGLLESRRFEEAIACIESHSSDLDPKSVDATYGDYLELMRQRRPKPTLIRPELNSPEDNLTRAIITQKSVALVATGEIKTRVGAVIDLHETVARVKFQGFEIMPKPEFSGTRCDLTAYTEDLVDKFVAKSNSDPTSLGFLSGVKLIVLKRKSVKNIGGIPARAMDSWAPTFMTTATSGTLLLFDILRYKPKRIMLFGFNYYTERQIYNSALLDFYKTSNAYAEIGLPKNWFDLSSHQRASATIASGFIAHDPRSDFLLVKNLYELSGLIDGTPEVLEILNLTADEYDARLEEMLGDW